MQKYRPLHDSINASERSTLLPSSTDVNDGSGENILNLQARSKGSPKTKSKARKLETFEGVFLPTALNVLSILMFLRFGFIIGQMGILGTLFLLVLSYTIDILTTLSISAISTNGTVKGGGAYYMISRSLGPEFGGAIGIIFFIGQILNSSLNVVGFTEPLIVNFGNKYGDIYPLLQTGYWWQLLYSTILLALCTCVAMVGASLVSKTAFWLFIALTISTISIPISSFLVSPFDVKVGDGNYIWYSGLSLATALENLWPRFTSGAAGSVLPPGQTETFRNLFGIFFPSTAGIFAGASMSGSLKNPSKSIPTGTLKGLLVTFILYSLVIISMGCSIPRELLHSDIKVIQTVNIQGLIIIIGELSTSLFSVIMGIVGAASMLSAIAGDKLMPGLSAFSTIKKNQKEKRKAEIISIVFTWFLAQLFLFADINQIATFITMAFLMTFIVMNLACFLLRVGSAPNFRPSFKYFSRKTALTGVISCLIAMYIVDGISATLVIFFLFFLILAIHYLTPPQKFGDISQLLIYHQVRKYLLRLKLQVNIKYWRPQILLLCDDPKTSWNLIGFCNHLKKGGLYILGHVILVDESSINTTSNQNPEFNAQIYKEVRKQESAWQKLRDLSKIKAFVQVSLGPTLSWGVRNIYMGSGLGGMKPNITVIGFYELDLKRNDLLQVSSFMNRKKVIDLPTESCRKERKVTLNQWVQIVEDLIIMRATVAVAANFYHMDLPFPLKNGIWKNIKNIEDKNIRGKYIDLYPIQMSSINVLDNGKSILSTNFDTYTLILQLGSILSTVNEWKYTNHKLRIIVFVESSSEVEEEHSRLKSLLDNLRIEAECKIISLDKEDLMTYNFLIRGYSTTMENQKEYDRIDSVLKLDQWWKNLQNARQALKEIEKQRQKKRLGINLNYKMNQTSNPSFSLNDPKIFSPLNLTSTSPQQSSDLSKGVKNRRYTLSNLHEQGLSLSFNMSTQNTQNYLNYNNTLESTATSSSSDTDSEDELENNIKTDRRKNERNNKYEDKLSKKGSVKRIVDKMKNVHKKKSVPKFNLSEQLRLKPSLSTDQLSIRSVRSNLKPNFLSYKIPQSKVNSDEEGDDNIDGDEDDQMTSSIRFVNDDMNTAQDHNSDEFTNEKSSKRSYHTANEKADFRPKGHKSNDYFSYKSISTDEKNEDDPLLTPSILTQDDRLTEQLKSPALLALDDEDSDSGPESSIHTSRLRNIAGDGKKSSAKHTDTDDGLTQKQLIKELNSLTFNNLPAKGQHLILNELMKVNSPKSETSVIFTTLPAPVIGTHLSYDESLDYIKTLEIWLEGLPPTMLINSQTVTVTTDL